MGRMKDIHTWLEEAYGSTEQDYFNYWSDETLDEFAAEFKLRYPEALNFMNRYDEECGRGSLEDESELAVF